MAERPIWELDGSHDQDPGPIRFWHPVLDELDDPALTEQFAMIEFFHQFDVEARIASMRAERAAAPTADARQQAIRQIGNLCKAFNAEVSRDDARVLFPLLISVGQLEALHEAWHAYVTDHETEEGLAGAAHCDKFVNLLLHLMLDYLFDEDAEPDAEDGEGG